ncbi:MAG: secretin N-terminal domain-containing protein [bacterium]
MKTLFPFGLWIPTLLLLGVLVGGCSLSAPAKCLTDSAALGQLRKQMRMRMRRGASKPTPRVSQVVRLKYARAGEVASTLRALDRGRQSLFDHPILATAYYHANALVLVGTASAVAKLVQLVRKLDTPRQRIRVKVSLMEGTTLGKGTGTGKGKGKGTGAGTGTGTGTAAATTYRLTRQRVLDSTTLVLADREERPLRLSAALRQRLGCLWGGKSPRLRLQAHVGQNGRILITLSNVFGKHRSGPGSRRKASIAISVANGQPVAIAFSRKDLAAHLPAAITFETSSATRAKGFVVNDRCHGRASLARLLVITPVLEQS